MSRALFSAVLSAVLPAAWRGAVAAAMLASTSAMAVTYYKWEAVEMPAASGVACGNGSVFRVFVNRTPKTSKTVVFFEAGGACWSKGTCRNEHNRDGVAANYMSDFNQMAAGGLISPFIARLDPLQKVQTQGWNFVYVPYCTADVHGGDKVTVYTDEDATTPDVTQYHRGARNIEALADWMSWAGLSRK